MYFCGKIMDLYPCNIEVLYSESCSKSLRNCDFRGAFASLNVQTRLFTHALGE